MQPFKERNHPIIIGVGQSIYRDKIIGSSVTSIDLAVQAIEACVEDTGRTDILKFVDALDVVCILTEYEESPVPKIARRLGIDPPVQEETAMGGNNPQWLVNRAADRIMAGDMKLALITGAETLYRDVRFDRLIDLTMLMERQAGSSSILGDQRIWATEHEMQHGADIAIHIYPLFDTALRAHLNLSLTEHRAMLNAYMDGMAAAAADNPLAWFKKGKRWNNIAQPTEDNPIYNYPYTKYMNPNPAVNQGAAVLVTDTNTAKKLGIARDKWIYLHGGAEAHDKWFISERVNYYSSPVVRLTAEAALKSAGLDLSQIGFFDLYSCFPSAVLIAAMEIGLPMRQLPPLTITGGLSFFGGPGNNYTMHSIAHAVERLRKHREEYGFLTGVGHDLTKHAVGIYSGIEPAKSWQREPQSNVQKRIDALPSPAFCHAPHGPATVETYTVSHDREDGVPQGVIFARLDSGERCIAVTPKDPDLIDRMETEEFIGYRGFVKAGDSGLNIFS